MFRKVGVNLGMKYSNYRDITAPDTNMHDYIMMVVIYPTVYLQHPLIYTIYKKQL